MIWGINSFDQWGVELGKALAHRVLTGMLDPGAAESLDASTRSLIESIRRNRG